MGAEKIGSQLIADYVKEKTGEEVSFPGGESKEAEPKTLNEYVEREKRMDSQVIEDGGSVEDEKEESSGESTQTIDKPSPKQAQQIKGAENRIKSLEPRLTEKTIAVNEAKSEFDTLHAKLKPDYDAGNKIKDSDKASYELLKKKIGRLEGQQKQIANDINEAQSHIDKNTPSTTDSNKPEEPTVEANAQTLLDRTTNSTTELKETKKEVEGRQKSLERELEGVGDDAESRKQITDQLDNAKNKVDNINANLQSQRRKLDMANALLNKKPSLNGAEQDS